METELQSEGIREVSVNAKDAIEAAEKDLNFLGALVMVEHFLFMFPHMFLQMWLFLKSKVHLVRDFSKLAIGIPRGFAKTTLVKLWIVYCVLFTKTRFILIISSSEDH